jgi:AcrR family transcriptional regulator
MDSEKRPRPYRKRRRADTEAETRRRITEAAVRLHGTVGPARTTIKDVAAEAGVQRATVYRHFPDLESLFASCSAHWASLNPAPDPADWESMPLEAALTELYAWYEWGEAMLVNVRRDLPLVPAMAGPRAAFDSRFKALHAALMKALPKRRRVAAAVAHAMQFETWRSLARDQGLSRRETVELMVALVQVAAVSGSARGPALSRPAARRGARSAP